MKAVFISIQPKWVEKIANGEKTIEVRKSIPKLQTPFKCYIYCTRKERLLHIFHKGEYIFSDDHSQGKFDENIFVKDNYYFSGKVIGEFTCDKIYNFVQFGAGIMFADNELNQLEPQLARDMTCLTDKQIEEYFGDKDGYGWHISDLKIYDKPKELSEFKKLGSQPKFTNPPKLKRPPQPWCYVEEIKGETNNDK